MFINFKVHLNNMNRECLLNLKELIFLYLFLFCKFDLDLMSKLNKLFGDMINEVC